MQSKNFRDLEIICELLRTLRSKSSHKLVRTRKFFSTYNFEGDNQMYRFLTLLVCVAFAGALGERTVEGRKPATDTAATTTIQNSDGSGTFFRIQSDGLGSYSNGVNSVSSVIQAIGDWAIDTKSSSVRKAYIDFGDPVIPGDQSAPFASANVPFRIISKCLDSGIKMQNFTLNQSVNCPFSLTFDYGTSSYAVRMNEVNVGTEPVNWTCLAVSSGKCVSWQMVPSVVQADGQRKVKAQLIRLANGKKNPEQTLGQFYFAFEIDVTTP
jgi:hypothetical protein